MYKERFEKCVNRINEKGLDGVIYAQGANFQYLTDETSYFWQRSCMNNLGPGFELVYLTSYVLPESLVYITSEGECTIFTIPRNKGVFTKHPVVYSYMDQFEDTISPYIKPGKIGVGFACNQYIKDTLKEVDSTIETVDAEDLFFDIRAIKDEEEIAQLTKLAKFTDDAVMYVVTHLKEGMTQYEAEKMLMDYGFEHGIQDFSFPPTAGFKTRGTFTKEENFIFPRTSVLTPGTGIAFDVGYMDQGYCSDWGRTLYFGKAPEYIKNGYEALQAGQVHMIESIVPNKTRTCELYGYVMEEVKERGYEDVLRFPDTGSLGHQIGIDCHEPPMLSFAVDEVLKPGMVFCSEPKMMFDNELYMRVEDMILVTETGAVSLSNFPRDMFEFGND